MNGGERGAHGVRVVRAEDRAGELEEGAKTADGDAQIVDRLGVGRAEDTRDRLRELGVEGAELAAEEGAGRGVAGAARGGSGRLCDRGHGGYPATRMSCTTVTGLKPSERPKERRTAARTVSATAVGS